MNQCEFNGHVLTILKELGDALAYPDNRERVMHYIAQLNTVFVDGANHIHPVGRPASQIDPTR